MAVTYDLISQLEMDISLVRLMRDYQRTHWEHSKNIERYTTALSTMPDGEEKTNLEGRLAESTNIVARYERLINALLPQMPTRARIDAARTRI